MSVKLPINSSDDNLITAVEDWVDFLVKEDYQKAFDFTEQDPYYNWSPELIEKVVNNYGMPGIDEEERDFKVTSPKTAVFSDSNKRYSEVDYFEEPHVLDDGASEAIAEIWYDLPLNGEWSDLTATFHVIKKEDFITLQLREIHVF